VSVGASGRQDGDYGELKKKFELFVSNLMNRNTIWSVLGFDT